MSTSVSPQGALVQQFIFAKTQATITAMTYKGRGVTFPSELESALGLTPGSIKGRLHQDKSRPADERFFLEGRDFDVLDGDDLDSLKDVFASENFSLANLVNPMARSLLILYRTGVDMVCLRSNKPIAVALCRFLVDHVFPALRKGELSSATMAQRRLALREKDAKRKDIRARLRVLRNNKALTPVVRDAKQLEVLEEAGWLTLSPEEKERLARVQTPLSSFPGAPEGLELVAEWLRARTRELKGDERMTPSRVLYDDFLKWSNSPSAKRRINFIVYCKCLGMLGVPAQLAYDALGRRRRSRPVHLDS